VKKPYVPVKKGLLNGKTIKTPKTEATEDLKKELNMGEKAIFDILMAL
jgi:hypothetical protein